MMLIQDIEKILTDSGIEPNEAKVEVRLLIEHFAGYSLVDILMGKKLTEDKLKIVEEKAKLRAKTHEPIQYIIGLADFMGEKFLVNKDVLIPRDETELLVRKAIEIIKENNFKMVLDMCTGSGCIACMIAKLTNSQAMGVDISTEAIHTAFKNMEKFGLYNRAIFRKSDIYSKIREDEKFDLIVSNPPYIPPKEKETIQEEVSYEPDLALYTTDEKGLAFYEKIIKDAPKFLNKGGYLMFELGIGQSTSVAQLMKKAGFENIKVLKDLANIDRVIFGTLQK
ncbi:TPA: protein-(glutamine-N5) methyltransferase, release factor-specific [Candidatus Gastranaerophilales bacterium HUM_6]|jgi:protein-(glutamine-N5) methyltransferase, release factor-specific|nr:MAG TPA: protein-(glutamine-N5) methyltransferase, release factor-specific [Candidatus Gastranaerophilales bacterium HUM_6]DAA93476.1 MAG TPA: protein-(glutamine-N5) methyltransferase, release factor-specific [Candidatus Gastranaerophilales bacterium HUM_7]DAA99926.1 MAG TPA: protein-(glutamine-N5) methyltransferase, release factor-specific [Candidatus Gastranaerophilales bacterium HUM_12]DAB08740.1 MAG TPA: protein-(glutamine-N5) methyltransferase, release factor-specific [Candidatus Gastran